MAASRMQAEGTSSPSQRVTKRWTSALASQSYACPRECALPAVGAFDHWHGFTRMGIARTGWGVKAEEVGHVPAHHRAWDGRGLAGQPLRGQCPADVGQAEGPCPQRPRGGTPAPKRTCRVPITNPSPSPLPRSSSTRSALPCRPSCSPRPQSCLRCRHGHTETCSQAFEAHLQSSSSSPPPVQAARAV